MSFFNNAVLGSIFLFLAFFLVFLMFYLWKFPFDSEKHKSTAPSGLMLLHRGLGYIFVIIYIFLMWDMVPRLWSYQIELPARTVVHLTLGIAIGAILIIKIMVVRYFKHLESKLAPYLGTSLLIFTILLTGLALPYSAREAYLRLTAQDGQNFSEERLQRVRTYLPQIGFEDKAGLKELASSRGLADGRVILTRKCTQCHDLRTILAKPRTPDSWYKTVKRMSNRSTILTPISETEQWQVTAYLVAISPTLRETVSDKKKLKKSADASKQAAINAAASLTSDSDAYDATKARGLFEAKCSQCHSHILVEDNPPETKDAAVSLVQRMVRNGLTASDEELATIMRYLSETYAKADDAKESQIDSTPPASTEAVTTDTTDDEYY